MEEKPWKGDRIKFSEYPRGKKLQSSIRGAEDGYECGLTQNHNFI